ncbi:MAG: isoleucine--tRNA ligase [Candidatus Latescibacteria bacterium]|nr:isoleucine--tRNA ligase [Candidatus Latescibacterota bacterium]
MSATDTGNKSPFQLVDEVNHSPGREEAVLEWWRKNDIFRKTVEMREGAPDYVFYEGPPTANGLPGVHHVQSRTYKDLVCRLKTMEGYRVIRKAGWDTHGLPVEIEVEKQLGLNHKAEIEEYGITEFNEICRTSVRKYEEDWRDLTERIAFWLDLDDPYFTFTKEYIETVWWILSRFFKEGLIYEGRRILPYCPRCGTPLSSHEVSLGYESTEDPSIYVRFPVLDPGPAAEILADLPEGMSRSLLVWTTTPWTMISNTFTVVHADLTYVEIEVDTTKPFLAETLDGLYGERYAAEVRGAADPLGARERLILALNRALDLFGNREKPGSWKEGVGEVARFMGSDLVGLKYQRPFTFMEMDETITSRVVADDYVTDEDGTGLVHSSPAYGEDDYNTGQREGMPVVETVDNEGKFKKEVTSWAGVFVKEADPQIIRDLAERGLLFGAGVDTHTYPFCWRCESPLLYMAQPSWYIRTTAIKEQLLSANRSIDWVPPEIGTGRMGEWLENNQDWALSRNRYWGTPLPIWRCDNPDCGHLDCIGSVEELKEHSDQEVPEDFDPHKPFVDSLTWSCSSCSPGTMWRTPEVIDVWFDSGAMPFAQWHYPFENREIFESQFPADFISEGVDQTRGWFYSLLVISAFLMDRPPYKHCLVTELVLDKEGQKMSKSKGNTVDPWGVINRWGVDPLRWYLVTNSPPWASTRFDEDGIAEVSRKFFGTLHNTHSFFVLYADIDGFDPDAAERIPVSDLPLLDRWVLSRLHRTTRAVRRYLGGFEVTRAARALQYFVIEDLSNWYVRRSRRRFWKGEPGPDKNAAYQTLHEVLVTCAGLLAPFVPFTSEEIWRNLQAWRKDAAESVHLSEYPAGESSLVDEKLERNMDYVRQVVALGRAARNRAGLKVRQPLRVMKVVAPHEWQKQALKRLESIILEEMNIKSVEAVASTSDFMKLAAQPDFSNLGPRFGKQANMVAGAIRAINQAQLELVQSGKGIRLEIEGESFDIEPSDVIVEEAEPVNLVVEREGDLVVGVDTELDQDLIEEGLAREFTTRIQGLRRNVGYAVTDRIRIGYQASTVLESAVAAHKDYVAEEALAVVLQQGLLEKSDRQEEWKVDGESVTITIANARGEPKGD